MTVEQPTQPWYTKTWAVVLALLLFFPVGLYLMWRFTRWEVWVKTVVSVVISLIVILVVVSAAIGGDESDDEVVREEATPSPTVAAATPTPQPTEPLIDTAATATAEADDVAAATATAEAAAAAATATVEIAEPTAAVGYEIASREDVSFGAVVRIVYRVEVSGPLTEEELGRIAQEIIDDETDQQDVNAIGFFFYLPGTDTNSGYTAGVADWAPDGDWAKADTVQAGDYSSHELGAIAIVEP